MKNKKIIFDLCGTIVKSNTTFDFIKYYHKTKKNHFHFFYMSLLTSFLGKIFHRIFKFSMRKAALKTIRGIPLDQLEKTAKKFSEITLKNQKNDIVIKIFNFYNNKNCYDIIIASASISPVVQAFSERLNIPFVSTILETKDNNVTGNIRYDMKGNKLASFMSDDIYLVVTDNFDDLPLIRNSEKAIIITKKKHAHKWKIIGLNRNKEYLIEL